MDECPIELLEFLLYPSKAVNEIALLRKRVENLESVVQAAKLVRPGLVDSRERLAAWDILRTAINILESDHED